MSLLLHWIVNKNQMAGIDAKTTCICFIVYSVLYLFSLSADIQGMNWESKESGVCNLSPSFAMALYPCLTLSHA